MKKWSIMIGMAALLGAALSIFASCGNENLDHAATASDATPLQGLSAKIAGSTGTRATRAASSEPQYVGREKFVGGDQIKMTKFMRTEHSITNFTYADEDWKKESDEAGWTRASDETTIYWSDAASEHTFIGYSLPYEGFSWTKDEGTDVYHGQLTLTGDTIDYTNYTQTSTDASTDTDASSDTTTTTEVSGNEKLKKDDVVLTYSSKVVPDATGIANIQFRHGLACLTVMLNINGFSSTAGVGDDEKDNSTRVVSVKVLNQPYKYKWDQLSDAVTLEDENSTATVKAWTDNENGDATTSGRDRRFYYHTLAVPGKRSEMDIEFTVTYHDPNNTSRILTNTYTAKATDVELVGGKRTIINISLNHLNEEMTVGTEYIDWEFYNTPDEAELSKNSIYLSSTDEGNVVYHDKVTTADDAVWLYTDKSTTSETVKDIYGNDGSKDKPYSIATANQLLCFAYEVKRNKMNFEGKHIQLDANLYMQASTSGTVMEWNNLSIGTSDNPFRGHFYGGLHSISRLNGNSLFGYIGSDGTVEGVSLENMLGTKNGGSVAYSNAGTITGCAVNGDVSGQSLAGGICATNSGTISACYHIGAVKAATTAGTIAGENTGTGTITGNTCYAASGMTGETVLLQCYYDTEFYPSDSADDATTWGKTSSDLMKNAFVTALNGNIGDDSSYKYQFSPSEFPKLVEKSETGQ